jgi:hypothetical protein
MKLLLLTSMLVVAVLFTDGAQALEVVTTVDFQTQSVRLDFTDLPPYQQIRLEGVTELFWCNCVDPDNPSSIGSTGFTVNGTNLEMKYEGAPPPSANYIDYYYLDESTFVGFESLDWIVISSAEGDLTVTGDQPFFVTEPSMPLLRIVGLMTLPVISRLPRPGRAARVPANTRSGHSA